MKKKNKAQQEAADALRHDTAKPKHGDLRVWHIPQIPGRPFHVPVKTLSEAKLVLDTLAQYDLFQLAHNIKPDYSNAGGLQAFDANDDHDGPDGSWIDWYGSDAEEIDSFTVDQLRTSAPTWEMAELV